MLEDLMMIRADRSRYYYGADDLFKHHPDLVDILTKIAPELLPTLLDGMIWRSRTTSNGLRRVNYYLKHLLVAPRRSKGPLRGCQRLLEALLRTRRASSRGR